MRFLLNKHKARMVYSINSKTKNIYLPVFLSIFITFSGLTYKIIEKSFQQPVSTLAVSYANNIASQTINDTVMKTAGKDIDYSELYSVDRDENGKILSVTSNPSAINDIKQRTIKGLVEDTDKLRNVDVGIPIGNLTNMHIFSGRGFNIPIRILITGSPMVDFKSEFLSAGINQTKHRVLITTRVDIDVILPFETVTTSITTDRLLIETIIVGEIPNVYVTK